MATIMFGGKKITVPKGYRALEDGETIPDSYKWYDPRYRVWKGGQGLDAGRVQGFTPLCSLPYPHAVPITEAPKKPKAPVVQETSREALKSQKDKAPTDCGAILARLKQRRTGLTCDALETLLSMSHQTASARLRDLAMRGDIRDSGKRRKTRTGRTAIVWQVATA